MVAALLWVARATAVLAESNGSLPLTHVTCRLTAKNRDQLRNPTLGNRLWTTFVPIFSVAIYKLIQFIQLRFTRSANNLICDKNNSEQRASLAYTPLLQVHVITRPVHGSKETTITSLLREAWLSSANEAQSATSQHTQPHHHHHHSSSSSSSSSSACHARVASIKDARGIFVLWWPTSANIRPKT